MRKVYFILLIFAASFSNLVRADVSVDNNYMCTDAIDIDCIDSYTGSTVNAPTNNPAGKSGAWFKFLANGNNVTFNTNGSKYDTYLYVYNGTCDQLNFIVSNDDGGDGLNSKITINTVIDQIYYVFVSGYGNSKGTYILNYETDLVCSKVFRSFTVDSQVGSTEINNQAGTIHIKVPYGTGLRNASGEIISLPFIPIFETNNATSVKVEGVDQVSGVTENDFINGVSYTLTETNGKTKVFVVYITEELGFESFGFENQVIDTKINTQLKDIYVSIPVGSQRVDNIDGNELISLPLVANFTVSNDVIAVKVNGNEQISRVTENDFKLRVFYDLYHSNGTKTSWSVWVREVSPIDFPSHDIGDDNSYFKIIGQVGETDAREESKLLITMPANTDVTQLIPEYSLLPGTSVSINGIEQQSGVSVVDFTFPVEYYLISADGMNSMTFTLEVVVLETSSEISPSHARFISDNTGVSTYINHKAKEIDITLPLNTYLPKQEEPWRYNCYIAFYGDNAKGAVVLNEDEWYSGSEFHGYRNYYLNRAFSDGSIIQLKAEDGSIQNYRVNINYRNYYSTTHIQMAVIDRTSGYKYIYGQIGNSTITFSDLPHYMDLSNAYLYFYSYNNSSVYINGKKQYPYSYYDLSAPLTFQVIAEDGISYQNYIVTANKKEPSGETDFNQYYIPGQNASSIDYNKKVISVEFPKGVFPEGDIAATFELSTGAVAYVNDLAQISGSTSNNLTSGIYYHVMAQNGINAEMWRVDIVHPIENSIALLTNFSVAGQLSESIIDHEEGLVYVSMRENTPLNEVKTYYQVSSSALNYVNDIQNPFEEIKMDLSNKVVLKVVSEDQSNQKQYEIRLIPNISTDLDCEPQSQLNIYPIPASNRLNIEKAQIGSNIELIGLNGKVLLNQKVNSSLCQLNISQISSGVYFIKVTQGNTISTHKVLVK